MTKVMKARKSGFTLVELLIVVIIIAILAGMLLLATGSATDSAEATKIVNDLRGVKAAALVYYLDNEEWPTETDVSIDVYMDRPFFTGPNNKHTLKVVGPITIDTHDRSLIGFQTKYNVSVAVQKRLQDNAEKNGILTNAGTPFKAAAIDGAITAYMFMK